MGNATQNHKCRTFLKDLFNIKAIPKKMLIHYGKPYVVKKKLIERSDSVANLIKKDVKINAIIYILLHISSLFRPDLQKMIKMTTTLGTR